MFIATTCHTNARRTVQLTLAMLAMTCAQAQAFCWQEAGQRQGLAPELLYAIAKVESGLNPQAINLSHVKRTNSVDIGLAQINSRWLPSLAQYGVTRESLTDPCTNVHVGAWILRRLIETTGDAWEAVGAYNAACTQLKGEACQLARRTYAWKVYRNLPSGAKVAAPTPLATTPSLPKLARLKVIAPTSLIASLPQALAAPPVDAGLQERDSNILSIAQAPINIPLPIEEDEE